jgi:hypothetical protein
MMLVPVEELHAHVPHQLTNIQAYAEDHVGLDLVDNDSA